MTLIGFYVLEAPTMNDDFDESSSSSLSPKSNQSDDLLRALTMRFPDASMAAHNARNMADAVIQELDNMGIIHLSKVRHDG